MSVGDWLPLLDVALDVTALTFAQRVVRSRPLSLLLAFALVDELAIRMLQSVVLEGAPRPFAGLARVAYHAETAFVIGWPAALAAASWAVFARRRVPWIGWAWAAVLAVLVMSYPLPRGWTAPVLHAVELAGIAAAAVPIWRAWTSDAPSSRPGIAVGLLVAVEVAVSLLGAWAHGSSVFTRWNELARLPYVIGWTVLVVLLVSWWRPWKTL